MPLLKNATSSLSPDRRLVVLVSCKGWLQPLPSITNSKHVLRRCHSVRCGADMADTLSTSASSVTMRHTASRSLVAEWHIVTCHVFEVLLVWSMAKAVYRHCQVIGPRLAIASCWRRCNHQQRGHAGSAVVPLCQPSITTYARSLVCWAVMRSRRAAMT